MLQHTMVMIWYLKSSPKCPCRYHPHPRPQSSLNLHSHLLLAILLILICKSSRAYCPLTHLDLHNNTLNASIILAYLLEEWLEKKGNTATYNIDKRYFPYVKCNAPRQHNGYDCGVYVVYYAEMILADYSKYTRTFIQEKIKIHFQDHLFGINDANAKRLPMVKTLRDLKSHWLALNMGTHEIVFGEEEDYNIDI